ALGGEGPVRMICPGKVYRRDNDDATHSHQFTQIEGLYVDKDVRMSDLKGTLDTFAKAIFGKDREIRLRPSFFPFTEPSVEMDIYDPNIYSGFAFGMGPDRIAMLKYGIEDIRNFYLDDIRFLQQFHEA